MKMKYMTSSEFPLTGNEEAKKKLLRPGAREPRSMVDGENKLVRNVTKHASFGSLSNRKQQD